MNNETRNEAFPAPLSNHLYVVLTELLITPASRSGRRSNQGDQLNQRARENIFLRSGSFFHILCAPDRYA